MRKILNVHRNDDPERYQCVGCSPNNPIGMKLEFWEDGDEIYAEWDPDPRYMGWINVLHGGIQATLLDEIAAWVVYVKCGTAGVTTNLNVTYKDTVFTNRGRLILRGKLIDQKQRFATIHAQIYNSEGKLCTEAEVIYFLIPECVAKEKFQYPGVDAFFEKDPDA